jgi:DNA-binding response OmpR family regulator
MIAELVAALRARDGGSAVPISGRYVVGDIEIDEHYRTVRRAGQEVPLRPKEYDLLVALARRQGAPVSKKALLEEVWQVTVASDSRTLDQHMFELRRKLEHDSQKPRHLVTIRKFGYCLRKA